MSKHGTPVMGSFKKVRQARAQWDLHYGRHWSQMVIFMHLTWTPKYESPCESLTLSRVSHQETDGKAFNLNVFLQRAKFALQT